MRTPLRPRQTQAQPNDSRACAQSNPSLCDDPGFQLVVPAFKIGHGQPSSVEVSPASEPEESPNSPVGRGRSGTELSSHFLLDASKEIRQTRQVETNRERESGKPRGPQKNAQSGYDLYTYDTLAHVLCTYQSIILGAQCGSITRCCRVQAPVESIRIDSTPTTI